MQDDMPNDFRSVLASVDRDGHRHWVVALIRWGRWRWLRLGLALPLIAFYLIAPLLTVGGRPALRLDLAERRFYLLGQVFWPQDFSYFVLMLLIGLVGTLLAVSLLGRVFCGWFCPHNVFLEMVFRPLEQLVGGRPGGKPGGLRRILTWGGFLLVAGALANAGTAFFTGPDAFSHGVLLDWRNHHYATGFWAVLAAAVLFNFTWFREQTCTIVCPYGRFQSAMLDPHSLLPAYDVRRGEPRGHVSRPEAGKQGSGVGGQGSGVVSPPAAAGDCIDCGLCVRVCPTAIDIRNGNQLECTHCAACIDACDQVMAKVGRKPGLIRYDSEEGLAGRARRILRPRTLLYTLVLTGLCTALCLRLAGREQVLVSPLRQVGVPVWDNDPSGRPAARAVLPVALVNRSDATLHATLSLPGIPEATLMVPGGTIALSPNHRSEVQLIAFIPRDRMPDSGRLDLRLVASANGSELGSATVTVTRP